MRVIHIIKATGLAGAERHLLDLLPGLRAAGCDARLVHLQDPRNPAPEFSELARKRGVPVSMLTIRRHLDPRLWFRLRAELHSEHADIVHTHMIHGDAYGIPAARSAQVPVVVSTRHNNDSFRYRGPIRLLNRRLWSGVDLGIAVSRAMERFSREIEGARGDLRVIHHGIAPVDAGREARRGPAFGLAAATGPFVGMVCRLTPQKGVADGVDAFARVAASFPHAALLVAGEGPERAMLEERARAWGIGKQVRFLGWQHDSGSLLAGLDVLMAPSRWEGFGLVVLEAMARGVPVLAARVGAIPELVAENVTGILTTPGEVGELAAGLQRLLADEELRKRLGSAALERARDEFSLERMTQATLRAYNETLQRKRSVSGG